MQTKNLTVTEMGETGKGLAILARLSEVDHDGDTYAPGAFSWKGDQWCPLIHHHDRYQMPFGKARVYEEGDIAYAELHLNLETRAGADWHKALLFDLATGKSVQEYSYGFEVLDADYNITADSRTRVLKQLDVHEVSTVVRGAGRGTRTLSMKELKDAAFAPLIGSLGELAEALKGDPQSLTATGRKQLEQIHAQLGAVLDPADPDAEAKALAAIEAEIVHHLTRDARRRIIG
jgi:HK97 family phage prohead protease